jgi:Tol biopolymer transport system component
MKRIGMKGIALLAVVTLWAVLAPMGAALAAPGDITLASTSDAEVKGNADSSFTSVSADGAKVAFDSSATNLDPADTDTFSDVYVKDLVTGNITLASTSDAGTKGNRSSFQSSLAADGTKVAFYSIANNLDPADTDFVFDIYVKDLVTGNITLASTSDTSVKGNGESTHPSLSADGTKVAFDSEASNLDPGDPGTQPDVYVKDLITGNITEASTSDTGSDGFGESTFPSLSPLGAEVAFQSTAMNLDPADTDPLVDIYVKDLVTGNITLASTSDTSVKGNANSVDPSLAAGGTKVAFDSSATNLDPADTDTFSDAYVKEPGAPAPATVVLDPPAATNPVGTPHTVTATVEDAFGNPTEGITVRFAVTGAVNTTGECTTNAGGECDFTYDGPQLPGTDAITAYADTDNDGSQDPGEPQGAAAKTWVAPESSCPCVEVEGWGKLSTNSKASFALKVFQERGEDPGGNVVFYDQKARLTFKSTEITSLVVTGSHATILGKGKANGADVTFKVDVDDATPDKFSIQLSSGYSASGNVKDGRIEIERGCEVEGVGRLSTNLKAGFALKVEFEEGEAGPEGAVFYGDKAVGLTFRSTKITSLVVTESHATIFGEGKANGVDVVFRVDVDDATPDTFTSSSPTATRPRAT